jgi:hypothetical protein
MSNSFYTNRNNYDSQLKQDSMQHYTKESDKLHEQYLRERPLLEEIRLLRSGKEEAERRLETTERENRTLVNRVRVLEEIEAKYFHGETKENVSYISRKASEAHIVSSERSVKPSIIKS